MQTILWARTLERKITLLRPYSWIKSGYEVKLIIRNGQLQGKHGENRGDFNFQYFF